VATSGGPDALDRLLRGERYDLVLCDLMMPELTGMALHDRIAERDPALASRFLFLTGGVFTSAAEAFLARTGAVPLLKPFEPATLKERIEVALAAAAAAAAADARP